MSDSPATEVHDAMTAAPSRSPHPYFAFLLRAGVGIAVRAFLIWRFAARPALHVLAHERLGFFAATFALSVAAQVMSAYRWQLLAAILGLRASFREFLA